MKKEAVVIEDLSLALGGRPIFDQVNFQANYGEVTGLVGPNGSGKSVFFKIISGFIRGQGSSISVNNTELLHTTKFPPNLGTLIEEPYFLNGISGLDNLLLLASIRNTIGRQQIINYMDEFSLPIDKQHVKVYSLGMKKKLGIIQAIMEQQTLVLLDEPMNALDEASVGFTRKLIRDMAEKENRSIILTSHNAGDIETLCDQVYHIEERRLVPVKRVVDAVQ